MEACMLQLKGLPGDQIFFRLVPQPFLNGQVMANTVFPDTKDFNINNILFHRLAAAMAGGGRLGDVEVNDNNCLERILLQFQKIALRESCFNFKSIFLFDNSQSQVLGKQGWELLHANPIVRVDIHNFCKIPHNQLLSFSFLRRLMPPCLDAGLSSPKEESTSINLCRYILKPK